MVTKQTIYIRFPIKIISLQSQLTHNNQQNLPINLNHDWIPWQDKQFLEDNLPTDIDTLTKLNYSILQSGLCPEDEWYKKGKNLINDKIIDFHRFTQMSVDFHRSS